MKNVIIALFALVTITACNNSGGKKTEPAKAETTTVAADTSTVNVYYFHGKARCKTCIAVGDVSKETIEKAFTGNTNVRFTEINTSEKANEALVEKYEVTWNALIITKGDQSKDLTEQAFATAVGNPEKLTEDIKTTVNSLLEGK